MSSEYKNIEHLFADKLQNMEVKPSDHVWQNIKTKKRRKGMFFFSKQIRIAAALVFLTGTLAAIWLSNQKDPVFQNEQDSKELIVKSPENNFVDGKTEENSNHPNSVVSESGSSVQIENTDVNNKNLAASKQSSGKIKSGNSAKSQTGKTSLVPSNKESTAKQFDNILLNSVDRLKLKYLIYPQLPQFVYSNKKIKQRKYTKQDVKINNRPEKELNKYSVEIKGGFTYATRKLSGEGSDLRNESENPALSVHTALKLNYRFNHQWSLQTGLISENRNEKVTYNQSELRKKLNVTQKQVVVYHPVLPPKTILVNDSSYVDEKVDYNFNRNNKYTTISMPLVLGYDFHLGKMNYRFVAGPMLNLHTSSSAKVLERSGNEILLVGYKENSSLKASIYTAMAMKFALSPTCNFLTEISYYRNLANRMTTESPIKQFNQGLNLSMGVSFDLRKK